MNLFDLTGKKAIVTGSCQGLGRSIAEGLAQAGASVCLMDLNPDCAAVAQEMSAGGLAFEGVTADLTDRKDLERGFLEAVSKLGGLDILVNNAGISFVGLLQDMSDAQWSEILNTNLSSVFYCCRSAIGHMVSQKSGKIINISSMWGTVGASCEAAYSATKSGMNGLTKALAKELAPSNVQVNAIACGVIDTAMNAQFSEEEREALREEIPAGRFADSEEVAALALTLASGHSYLTGQIIGLDGGYI